MPATQIFGYTPDNPDTGMVGYVAAHLTDGGAIALTVRTHGSPDGETGLCHLPAAEAEKLADMLANASGLGATAAAGPEPILQFFAYAHLPEHLQAVSRPFGLMAARIMRLPRNPERTTALRKLLEAKDCAVRALLADA